MASISKEVKNEQSADKSLMRNDVQKRSDLAEPQTDKRAEGNLGNLLHSDKKKTDAESKTSQKTEETQKTATEIKGTQSKFVDPIKGAIRSTANAIGLVASATGVSAGGVAAVAGLTSIFLPAAAPIALTAAYVAGASISIGALMDKIGSKGLIINLENRLGSAFIGGLAGAYASTYVSATVCVISLVGSLVIPGLLPVAVASAWTFVASIGSIMGLGIGGVLLKAFSIADQKKKQKK